MAKSILEIVKVHVTDATGLNKISKIMLGHAKRNAIIQASYLVVALLASVYAFVQREKYQVAINRSEEYRIKSERSTEEAAAQRAISAIAEVRLLEYEKNKK